MSVNFLNNSAIMVGLDDHIFYASAPPPIFQIPFPHYFYLVGAPFGWVPATFWNRTGKVTADAEKMIDVDFSLLLVPHMPLPPLPPGIHQVPNYAEIFATSGSEASLGIGNVTGEGDPLAACFVASLALNLNCSTEGDHPTGNVFCTCSVQTTPTWLDYALGAFKWFVVGFLGEFLGNLGGPGLGEIFGKVPGKVGKLIAMIPEAVWQFIVKQAVINAMEQVAVLVRYIARKLGY